MSRKAALRVGNVYRMPGGLPAMVLEIYSRNEPATGEFEYVARLRRQDGAEYHVPVHDLREHYPFLGLPRRVHQKQQANGLWYERFQLDDGPAFTNISEGYPSIPESRVAAWEASYAPGPEPVSQPDPIDHRLTRHERIGAGRAALNAWGRTPAGRLFWARLWAPLERSTQLPADGSYFLDAVAAAVRECLRESGGWKVVRRRLECEARL